MALIIVIWGRNAYINNIQNTVISDYFGDPKKEQGEGGGGLVTGG